MTSPIMAMISRQNLATAACRACSRSEPHRPFVFTAAAVSRGSLCPRMISDMPVISNMSCLTLSRAATSPSSVSATSLIGMKVTAASSPPFADN